MVIDMKVYIKMVNATGKEQQISIKASGGLSDDDIERMVQEAEANAEADKERREGVEVRNTADALVHAAEKNLVEHGDKVPDEDKTAIETAVAELKEALEGDDPEVIQEKVNSLNEVSMKLGEAMYKAAQAEGGAEGMAGADMGGMGAGSDSQQTSSGGDDNFVDADFEEVDPDAEAKDKKND